MSKVTVLIPARLGSTRFPNKPLADIQGKPMIVRVCGQAEISGYDDIVVACCENEVKQIVESSGFKAVMTNPDLPSGTDRIYEALVNLSCESGDGFIVNLQGDLPNINPEIIRKAVKVLEDNDDADIATAVVEIKDQKLVDDPNVVKAVVNFTTGNSAEVHYFSRSTIPYGAPKLYEHIGIYVYRSVALKRFVTLPPSYFETCEKLEQLRAIENGMKIYACEIPYEYKPISVDTKEDLDLLPLLM